MTESNNQANSEMNQNPKSHLNIFLDSSTDNIPKRSKDNNYENYVIVQNDILHKENRDLSGQVKELERRISEFEEDEGRAERRISNMKGLLQNFHAMNKTRKDIQERQEKIIRESVCDKNSYMFRAIKNLRVLETIMVFFIAVCCEYYSTEVAVPVITLSLFVTAFQESLIYNFPKLEYSVEKAIINKKKKEIEDTEKGQDYIYEFLDQQ